MNQSLKRMALWSLIICSFMWITCVIFLPENNNIDIDNNKIVVEIGDSVLTEIFIEKRVIDLGDVPVDSMVYADYEINNIGDNTLVIYKVNPDCSCTDYQIDSKSAERDGRINLQLKVDTHHKIGNNVINVLLHANTQAQYHMLKLKFNVIYD